MSIKGTECSELSVNFVALCMLNLVISHSVHASQKADVPRFLDCDYKMID